MSSRKILTGQILEQHDALKIELPVLYFTEDGVHFASAPALDITGYGENEKEAEASLNIMLEEFFNYAAENKTLQSELKKLGWQEMPPPLMDSLQHNSQLQNIINNKPFRRDKIDLQVPAY